MDKVQREQIDLLQVAVKDLVKLATLANNVVIKGQFSGVYADEVNELLQMCKHIHSTFVEVEEKMEKQNEQS